MVTMVVMGAWGHETFQDDWALDWVEDLRSSEDSSLVERTLRFVVEHGGTKRHPRSVVFTAFGLPRHKTDWLTARDSSRALAAAEVVAAGLGHPAAKLPDGLLSWLQERAASIQPEMVPLALKAVAIVKTNSELKDLWEEGDASEWLSAVEDLERRLGMALMRGSSAK